MAASGRAQALKQQGTSSHACLPDPWRPQQLEYMDTAIKAKLQPASVSLYKFQKLIQLKSTVAKCYRIRLPIQETQKMWV